MHRNRRVQSAEVRFGPALKVFAICLLIVGAAVGYVGQKAQVKELKERERILVQQVEALRRENDRVEIELARRRSPPELEMAVRRHGLDLVYPHPGQIIRLSEPGDSLPGRAEGASKAGVLANAERRP